ncbi:MAG: DUF167 domain-containing protein [Pseudomonadota bacterium]|nr:DUF167 domain-containing protein [Pseudomonadota bacterium]
MILALQVQPRARRMGIIGPYGDRLKIAIAAPAHKGRANQQLLRWLAVELDLPLQQLELVQGATSRAKRIRIRNAPPLLDQRLRHWDRTP